MSADKELASWVSLIGEKAIKGSRQMKKPEIVWFFTKQGGGEVPPNQTISGFFTEIFLALK